MYATLLLIVPCFLATFTMASGTRVYTRPIEIQSGQIRGVVFTLYNNKTVREYLGIPYAQAQRFERPVAPQSWTGVKDVVAFGKVCHQELRILPFGYRLSDMSEDCLNLNVYVPNTQTGSALLPVMVWIHGGGFTVNSNRIAVGSYLADLGDVVVVSINYRLGLFGFLASNEYNLTGNYGLYDQLEALKWVQNNIDKFGGDPRRVTIFGNSAGGASVSILSMTPLARGLFNYTIMQSGVANIPIGYSLYQDKSVLLNFARRNFNCTDANMKECLKGVSATDIVNAGFGSLSFNAPAIDGQFLTENPLDMVKNVNNALNPQSVMIGVADDDGSCFTNAIPALSDGFAKLFHGPGVRTRYLLMRYVNSLRSFGKVDASFQSSYARAIADNYDFNNTNFTNPDENHRIVLDLLKDSLFYAPGVAHAKEYARRRIPTYFYEVQFGLPMPGYFSVPPLVNAYHETEKFMEFGFALKNRSQRRSTGARLSREVMRMWTNFAKTGDPNRPQTSTSHVQWPQYNLSHKKHLVIKPTMEVKRNIRSQHVALWNTYLPSLGQGSSSNPDTKTSINTNKKKQKPKHEKKQMTGPYGNW